MGEQSQASGGREAAGSETHQGADAPRSPAHVAHESAYTAAHYRVFADPSFVLQVGEPSAALDALLALHAADTWAFVTACNPGSVPLAVEENAERMNRLRNVLTHFTTYPGESSDPAGDWTEPSVLVVGTGRTEAVEVAKAFGQNAILAGERGEVAELVWVG